MTVYLQRILGVLPPRNSLSTNQDTNIMETKIIRVGSSLGVIIPKSVATEGNFTVGMPLSVTLKNGRITMNKKESVREGWAKAFAAYAKEGEEEMFLPDFLDAETAELI